MQHFWGTTEELRDHSFPALCLWLDLPIIGLGTRTIAELDVLVLRWNQSPLATIHTTHRIDTDSTTAGTTKLFPMDGYVPATPHECQILDTVVQLVPVDMMDVVAFAIRDRTVVGCPNHTMFKHPFTGCHLD